MLLKIGIIFIVIRSTHCSNQNLGYTTDGLRKCLSDCSNGYCTTEQKTAAYPNPLQKPCQILDSQLKFYTTRYRQPKYKLCRDQCGFQGKSYQWCYVDDDKWDYCNLDTNVEFVTRQMTKNGYGPCQTGSHCKNEKDSFCNHYQDRHSDWDYCTPEWHTYVVAKNYKGHVCNDMCIMRGSNKYFECYDENGSLQICAPPARDFNELHDLARNVFKTATPTHNKQCESPKNRMRRTIVKRAKDDGFPNFPTVLALSYVLNYASLMEQAPEYDTQDVNETGNSVYRYTRIPSFFPEEPELPLVVRARITEDTIRARGSRTSSAIPTRVRNNLRTMGLSRYFTHNPDERGHLIGYQNGGPSEVYNFAPQTRRLNCGTTNNRQLNSSSDWLRSENIINAWVRDGNGYVEQTVVVYYADLTLSTRPVGFGMTYDLFNRDGTLHRQCLDFEFSNDPRHDGEIVESDEFWTPSDKQ